MPIIFDENGAPVDPSGQTTNPHSGQQGLWTYYTDLSCNEKYHFKIAVTAINSLLDGEIGCRYIASHTGQPVVGNPADLSWGRLANQQGGDAKKVLTWVCRLYLPAGSVGPVAFPLKLYDTAKRLPIILGRGSAAKKAQWKQDSPFVPYICKKPDLAADYVTSMSEWLDLEALKVAVAACGARSSKAEVSSCEEV